jgi:4-amino-4-deoxy-L-arabinose transferase-like glycosyltransferase
MKMTHQYAIVFLVSLALLLIGISTAPMMFDESYYVGAAHNFIAETPSSNPVHPPLAKYFIALSIRMFGDGPFGWRFPSAVAGAMVAVSVFGLAWEMTDTLHTAYIAWLLTVANGFWFVMSRVAMLSIFELAFETAGVWAFMYAAQNDVHKNETQPSHAQKRFAQKGADSLRWFALSGALFGLSIGCRWCGVIGLLVCVAYALFYCRPFVKSVTVMAGSAILAYAVSWVPLLVREHRTLRYLFTANVFIYEFHRHAPGDPRLGEVWWSWIFRLQPQPALGYLVGNPIIGVLGLAAVVFLIWQKKLFLPALYIAHVLQWAIGVRPLTFYYYYLEAFTWLTLALAVALQGVAVRRVRLDVVTTGCAAVAFVYWCQM